MDILLGTRKKITWWNEVDETMDVKGSLILATFLLMEPSTIVAPEALSYVRTLLCNWRYPDSYSVELVCVKQKRSHSSSPAPMRAVISTPTKPAESLASYMRKKRQHRDS